MKESLTFGAVSIWGTLSLVLEVFYNVCLK